MGVWERSPVGRDIAYAHADLQNEFRRALPDFTPEDVVGSPYCVRRYVVDPHLGGPEGLATARKELAGRGLSLWLDFVPNHVAPDHPWVSAHPDYFIRGTAEDLSRAPGHFYGAGSTVFACGRDPYFPPWQDVLQLNAFHPGLRRAAIQTLHEIADQCDGVRCDMAMLLITRVFEQTWSVRAGSLPAGEYWHEIIQAIRGVRPDFLFVAEAYWDLEWELMQQGFDYCYDKRLLDRLEHAFAEQVRLHLLADLGYQEKLVRFIENHDEPRAAATFSGGREQAAAVTVLTLPGAKLLHEGQFEGRRVKIPVQLGRRPLEPANGNLLGFYQRLLAAVDTPAIREGEWQLCERSGWPEPSNHRPPGRTRRRPLSWTFLAAPKRPRGYSRRRKPGPQCPARCKPSRPGSRRPRPDSRRGLPRSRNGCKRACRWHSSSWSPRNGAGFGADIAAELATLAKRAGQLDRDLDQIRGLRTEWERAREDARKGKAPRSLLDRIELILVRARTVQGEMESRRANLLILQGRVSQGQRLCDDLLDRLADAKRARVDELNVKDAPPVWSPRLWTGVWNELSSGIGGLVIGGGEPLRTALFRGDWRPTIHLFFLLGVLLIVFVRLRGMTRAWSDAERPAILSSSILERPLGRRMGADSERAHGCRERGAGQSRDRHPIPAAGRQGADGGGGTTRSGGRRHRHRRLGAVTK